MVRICIVLGGEEQFLGEKRTVEIHTSYAILYEPSSLGFIDIRNPSSASEPGAIMCIGWRNRPASWWSCTFASSWVGIA